MAKHAKVVRLIREKIRNQEYEFVIPHFFEEMANDDLAFDDIENAITNGAINRVFTAVFIWMNSHRGHREHRRGH